MTALTQQHEQREYAAPLMRRLVVLFWLLTGITALAQQPKLSDLVRRYKPAVVVIRTYRADGTLAGGGTGFFIGTDRVVTNHHVLEDASRATITTADSLTYDILGVLVDEPLWDLMIVQTQVPKIAMTPLVVVTSLPDLGEELWVLGNPRGLLLHNTTLSVTRGIVSNVITLPALGHMTAIQFDASISNGNSGGPVFNEEGQVIGVVRSSVTDAQNLNFAIPGKYVNQLSVGTMRPFLVRRQWMPGEDSIVQEGQSLVWNGDFAVALPLFQSVVAHDSLNSIAWFYAGYCHAQLKNFETAVQEYRISYNLEHTAVALNNLGVAFSSLGLSDSAEVYFRRALVYQPDALVLTNVGMAFFKRGQMDSAQSYFQSALAVDPVDTFPMICMGNLLSKTGHYTEALETFRSLLTLVKDPREVYASMGFLFYQQRQFQSAITHYSKALRGGSVDTAAYRNWDLLGCAYIELGDYGAAVTALRTSLQLRADYPEAHADLGRALYRAHMYAESVHELKSACDRLGGQSGPCSELNVAYYNWCVNLARVGSFDSVARVASSAIGVGMETVDMYYWKGRALVELGLADEALAAFAHALQLDPQNKQVYLGVGFALQKQQRYADALERGFGKALEIDSAFGDALAGTGSCYYNLRDFRRAAVAYEHALRIDPDDPNSRYTAILTYLELEDKERACGHLQQLRSRDPALSMELAKKVPCK